VRPEEQSTSNPGKTPPLSSVSNLRRQGSWPMASELPDGQDERLSRGTQCMHPSGSPALGVATSSQTPTPRPAYSPALERIAIRTRRGGILGQCARPIQSAGADPARPPLVGEPVARDAIVLGLLTARRGDAMQLAVIHLILALLGTGVATEKLNTTANVPIKSPNQEPPRSEPKH